MGFDFVLKFNSAITGYNPLPTESSSMHDLIQPYVKTFMENNFPYTTLTSSANKENAKRYYLKINGMAAGSNSAYALLLPSGDVPEGW